MISLFAGPPLEGVEPSPELARILDMPRRDPEAVGSAIARPLTERLRLRWPERPPAPLPHELRWYQALALAEAHDFRGALIPLPVGAGKTLISALLPTVLGAKQALVLVPAKLRDKTERDFRALAQWWRVVPRVHVIRTQRDLAHAPARDVILVCSYEMLGTCPDLLLRLGPDAVIPDESYKLKNPKSGRTKRLWRYMRQYPDTPFVPLTGTAQKKGFRDWWHIQRGALPKALHVLPDHWPEMMQWNEALAPGQKQRRPIGALSRLCGPGGGDYEAVRIAYGERFRLTPGVITCPGGSCDASILFTLERVRHPEIEHLVAEMKRTGETPDGVPILEATYGAELWRHARELASGYIYRWKVPGPPAWMQARREAAAFVREVLAHSRTCDTELQVYQRYPTAPELVRWQRIRPTFTPEREPVWFTHDVIDAAVARARKDGALIWTEHRAVGEMIAERHGLPYFESQGRCRRHGSIMDYPGGPCVVSTTAIGEGFNLQDRWHKNLIMNCTPGCVEYEQLMGRTHRMGQDADVVEFTQLWVVAEQYAGVQKALDQARAAAQTDGQAKKLVLADIVET